MLIQLSTLLLAGSVSMNASLERALETAIDRAQERLVREVELWEDHSTWETAWEVTTENYRVRSTHSRYLASDLAEGLEGMLAVMRETLMTDPDWTSTEPFRIYVLPALADYTQFGNDHGAEHSSFYGSFYPAGHPERPVATFFHPNRDLVRMFATHSAFHQFVETAYDRRLPEALTEGLASYFALWWDFDYGVEEWEKMKRERRTIPLAQLLTTPVTGFTDRPNERLFELGMLVAYLLHHHPETRTIREDGEIWQAAFSEYLDVYLTGDDVELHPVHDLLSARLPELERDFFAYEFPRR